MQLKTNGINYVQIRQLQGENWLLIFQSVPYILSSTGTMTSTLLLSDSIHCLQTIYIDYFFFNYICDVLALRLELKTYKKPQNGR